jgi:ATP-dependent Clp protease ATP-binding subunit ClpC
VFERFTPNARQVLALAADEARELHRDYIGTEHLVLGLIREQDGLAAQTLDELGVTAAGIRAQLEAAAGERRETGQIPFLSSAKRALDAAVEQADAMMHSRIGTEHVLLGIVDDAESVGSRALGVAPERVRSHLLGLLGGDRPA